MVSDANVNEFSLAINPTDPMTAIITANDYDAGSYPVGPTSYRMHGLWGSIWTTHDGGQNWAHQYVTGRFLENSPFFGQEFLGDMVVTYGADGTAYIAGIAYASTGTSHHKLFVMSSSDGDNWNEPVIVDQHVILPEFHDKPALLVTDKNRLVLVWNFGYGPVARNPTATAGNDMKWATSDDGGATWETGEFSFAGSGISAALTQTPDGVIHAVYRTYSPLAILYQQSDNGQDWTTPISLVQLHSASTATPDANYRTFVLPDVTSTDDGNVWMIVANKDDNGDGEVIVMNSTNGVHWNTTRIDDGSQAGRYLAAIGSFNNTVVATWLDRGVANGTGAYHLMAATFDGSWQRTQITSAESPPGSAFFIGDYMDVDLLEGHVYMAWPDLRNDSTDLYAARLSL